MPAIGPSIVMSAYPTPRFSSIPKLFASNERVNYQHREAISRVEASGPRRTSDRLPDCRLMLDGTTSPRRSERRRLRRVTQHYRRLQRRSRIQHEIAKQAPE
jgi:hypothetical protein